MTRIVVDKSTNIFKPRSICSKKMFFRTQAEKALRDTLTPTALSGKLANEIAR